MTAGIFDIPTPYNEPILNYTPGSPETQALKAELEKMSSETVEIPLIIGGKEVTTGQMADCRMPHDHSHLLGQYHKGGKEQVLMAIEAAKNAKNDWANMPWHDRASILLKAGELLATKYRQVLNASTMLGQSKTCLQAEVDSACELIDFYRFNPYFMQQVLEQQPWSAEGMWNYLEHRPLEGFVFAVTPFNFTSIAGNLPTAPALMGNTVVWKPASSSVHSAYYIMKILEEAGMPAGVINLVPGSGGQIGNPAMEHPDMAGVHFTGSTEVFQNMWRTVGNNIHNYKSYPRIVGETGGKDFIFAHASSDRDQLITAMVRGAFEYQGQKCSAASRAYIPDTVWSEIKDKFVGIVKEIKMGDVSDFSNFMGAVIDKAAFKTITEYIDFAKSSNEGEILAGGNYDDSKGYFIDPTVVLTTNPKFKLIEEEIFGPVLTVYVYPEKEYEETLKICDETSPYALTGAVFGNDRYAVSKAVKALRNAAGNFYINDKPTGAVVGQQPFGGSRASGTNDKAGSMLNLQRWTSQRTIKENFIAPTEYKYPHMK